MVFGLNDITLLFQFRDTFIDNPFLRPTLSLLFLAPSLIL
jgi:hypothetical protein